MDMGRTHEVASDANSRRPVLVVDDEILMRMMIADELRGLGFAVIECGDAHEALDVLASGTPVSLVFSDVKMPGSIDGAALAGIVKREYPGSMVILTSGQQIPASVDCDHFFAKPWDVPHVVRHIKSLISV